MKLPTLTIAALLIAWPQLLVAQDEPPVLLNNPFSRPPSDVIVDDRVSVRAEEVVSTVPELQATMIGSINKLVNVDGRILKTGEEVQGYVVTEIHEQYAVFERGGRRTIVYVKPLFGAEQSAEDDE